MEIGMRKKLPRPQAVLMVVRKGLCKQTKYTLDFLFYVQFIVWNKW